MSKLYEEVYKIHGEAMEKLDEAMERRGVKDEVTQLAYEELQSYIQNGSDSEPLYPGISTEDENDQYIFQLVVDYLESIGLHFAPTVFRYESQNPNLFKERVTTANDYGIPSYDRTPLLTQMVERILTSTRP